INSSGDIFAGTPGGGVYRSTDDGDNWTLVDNGLTNTWVTALAINSSGDIFAATLGGGAFRSTDNGDSWTQLNTGVPDATFLSLLRRVETSLRVRISAAAFSGQVIMETRGARKTMVWSQRMFAP